MKANNLSNNTAYRITKGNDSFEAGDIIWMDRERKMLNMLCEYGIVWIEAFDISDEMFCGVELEEAKDCKILSGCELETAIIC